ncbi:MAG: fused MFS/spermidine synthase, partial [Rhizobiales bacterium]|nr:fused MFS/spermidine synthase [Hyphomicrobiales bacterium]
MSPEPDHPTPGEPSLRPHIFPLLVFVQFTVAAAGLVVEILAGRMLAPYVGMSLYTWTAVIAVVLAGFSAGHWVGGYIAERPTHTALKQTALAMALAALTTALTLIILRALAAGVISSFKSAEVSILILASAIAFLPSFFAGIPSPVLARIAVALKVGREGAALGAIFAASSLGAIAGTLATGFVFIAWLGTQLTILIVVITYVALAGLLLLRARSQRSGILIALISAGALLLSFSTLALAKSCTTESRYYCIRIIDFSAQAGTEAKLMVLDHLGHGINVKDAPARLITPYVALMDTVLRRRLGGAPTSSFFIGGGAYTLPRAWKAADPSARITVAEIDPEVTKLAQEEMWLSKQGIQVLHKDARAALEGLGRKFQVIVGDAFTDIAVPPHLVTREFFTLVQASLAPDGVYT